MGFLSTCAKALESRIKSTSVQDSLRFAFQSSYSSSTLMPEIHLLLYMHLRKRFCKTTTNTKFQACFLKKRHCKNECNFNGTTCQLGSGADIGVGAKFGNKKMKSRAHCEKIERR